MRASEHPAESSPAATSASVRLPGSLPTSQQCNTRAAYPIRLTHHGAHGQELLTSWCEFIRRWTWDMFGTFTFRGDLVHPEHADKVFRVWVSKVNRQLYGGRWFKQGRGLVWARALEMQERGTVHFHALLAGPGLRELWEQSWYRQEDGRWANRLMDLWDELAGYARLEVPRSAEAVTGYCSKYLLKGGELELGGPLERMATYSLPLVRSSNTGQGTARRRRCSNRQRRAGVPAGSPRA